MRRTGRRSSGGSTCEPGVHNIVDSSGWAPLSSTTRSRPVHPSSPMQSKLRPSQGHNAVEGAPVLVLRNGFSGPLNWRILRTLTGPNNIASTIRSLRWSNMQAIGRGPAVPYARRLCGHDAQARWHRSCQMGIPSARTELGVRRCACCGYCRSFHFRKSSGKRHVLC